MSDDLTKRYWELMDRVTRRKTDLTRAETRLDDAKVRVADTVAEVRSAGFGSVSDLRAERDRLRAALDKVLTEAERMLDG